MGTQMTVRPLRCANGPGTAPAVVVAGLRKRYGTVQAVHDVNFMVEEGEIGGQKRRLDLALGMIGDPSLLFLDEPTTGFDPSARREAWQIVRDLRDGGTTIVLTTHYMDEAQALADRVAVISDGRIVAEGTPSTIGGRETALTRIRFTLPPGDTLAGLPLAVRVSDNLVTVETAEPTQTLHTLTDWALRRSTVLTQITVDRPSLEDVYLRLTEHAAAGSRTESLTGRSAT